jgi:hypothetical protein
MSASIHVMGQPDRTQEQREQKLPEKKETAPEAMLEAIDENSSAEAGSRLAVRFDYAVQRYAWELERRATKAERALRKLRRSPTSRSWRHSARRTGTLASADGIPADCRTTSRTSSTGTGPATYPRG